MKNLVLPEAGAADDEHVLFLAVFAFFGRLFMVSLLSLRKMMLFWNLGSMYGRMSSAVPSGPRRTRRCAGTSSRSCA